MASGREPFADISKRGAGVSPPLVGGGAVSWSGAAGRKGYRMALGPPKGGLFALSLHHGWAAYRLPPERIFVASRMRAAAGWQAGCFSGGAGGGTGCRVPLPV